MCFPNTGNSLPPVKEFLGFPYHAVLWATRTDEELAEIGRSARLSKR
jgi:hypothetical protein